MTTNDPASIPNDPSVPRPASRARRRQRGQLVIPQDAEGRAALLSSLARRSYPTYELFVYAILCGAILGLGYMIDSQALLLFGVLAAPLMLPWVGLLLATVTGSTKFFFETMMALLISAALVFVIGALSGFAARLFMPRTFNEAFIHARLWWPDLIVLAIGAVILTISFVRSEDKPFLPSVMLAYEFFVPLSAGGFGLGSGIATIWPHGLLVFFVNFAWAALFGLITLLVLRFLPTNLQGIIFTGGISVVLVVILATLMSGGSLTPAAAQQGAVPPAGSYTNLLTPPTPTTEAALVPEPTSTPIIDTPTPSGTVTPTSTFPFTPVPLTLEITLPATDTPTVTLTFEPTPIYGRVHSGKGVVLRVTPAGKGITTLDDFSIVEILPDTQEVSGYTWAHVIASQNGIRLDGWIAQAYLEVQTPAPSWTPSDTPTISPTITATP
jgi:hypothetical protein